MNLFVSPFETCDLQFFGCLSNCRLESLGTSDLNLAIDELPADTGMPEIAVNILFKDWCSEFWNGFPFLQLKESCQRLIPAFEFGIDPFDEVIQPEPGPFLA